MEERRSPFKTPERAFTCEKHPRAMFIPGVGCTECYRELMEEDDEWFEDDDYVGLGDVVDDS